MILTVTPNAAVDKTYRVEGFALDRVNRPSEAHTVAGGKGINVARVYGTLGGKAVATGFLGGNQGRVVADALKAEGIEDACTRVRGETRLCLAVIDPTTGTQTEVNEAGPEVTARDVGALRRRVESLLSLRRFAAVVLSGSLPPGAPPTLYADLIHAARKAGVPAVLDASGAALREGVAASPWVVKPNRAELESLFGAPLPDADAFLEAARELARSRGIELVAATRGGEGAYLVAGADVWRATPPPVRFASAVASGDSFVAALLWAWLHGDRPGDPEAALRLAAGAGAANAAVIGAGFCSRESIFDAAARAELVRV